MEAGAITRYVRIPPTKVGVVPDSIRGKNVNEASVTLKYTPRNAAEAIGEALKSTAANAENNHGLNASRLSVAEAHVGHKPTLKRFRLMDHGRAFRVGKRTSNITLVVKERAQ